MTYNLPGNPVVKFDGDTIAGIFLGKITKWNDSKLTALNPGVKLPDQDIVVVHRSDGSGTTFIFTDYLSKISSEWKSKAGSNTSVNWPAGIGGKGNEGVAGLIRQTPNSIGYVELAYAKQNKFTVAHIQNSSGKFIEPSLASTTAAAAGAAAALAKDVRTPIANSPAPDAYPIAGLTYLLVYQEQKDEAKARALRDFIAWAISEGQSVAEELDYAKLPEPVVRVNEANLMKLTVKGKPIVASK